MLDIEYIILSELNTGLAEFTSIIVDIIPNTGNIITYTSGCPKNQNKCWYKIKSPPPTMSKKQVFKFLSSNIIVTPPASTGSIIISRTDVKSTLQINNVSLVSA
jgi:hypothetical protein